MINTSEPILRMRAIYETFPGVQALSGVDLDVYRGEVHAVMGENGAGKSTLIKIAAGVYPPTSGEIYLDGQLMSVESPLYATALGIAVIYQGLYLFLTCTVLENLFFGRQPLHRLLSEADRQRYADLLASYVGETAGHYVDRVKGDAATAAILNMAGGGRLGGEPANCTRCGMWYEREAGEVQ